MDRAEVGRVCLALPAVTLDHPFGHDHDTYKVGGRMFAMAGDAGRVSFKVSDIAYEVLTGTGRAQPAPYLARARWVNLDDSGDWDDAELIGHLQTAHALIVAKLTRKARAELGLT
ncbi:MmcQ/YjbR family DNA-binding protein [uncultured Brevundimonas sp.]|uniref:MmcQ/YjbR family DNA-binding protein n=1 Tax=uncultured Brevundimonas sp. TaxID=213418 RepID=UPI0030EED864|tara:strand:- start:35378 stop:35722 length:345 start_codon:yes stop_codon:yes gene_type:complete